MSESSSTTFINPVPASALPDILPIFPLAGVVLLPRARLPLNIFEARYLAMVEDALGQGRLIGMIQPTSADAQHSLPPLFQIGCVGRITSFTETEDGRFLINLYGVCRFRVQEELPLQQDYRRVRPAWHDYLSDVGPPEEAEFDRARLMTTLRQYFKSHAIAADWSAVQNTTNEMLISSLAMICPLEPNEKQALLEAPDLKTRAELLIALLEMAGLPQGEVEGARH